MLDKSAHIVPPGWARLGFRPSLVLRMFGMRRSGNHAIADWILRNVPGDASVFLNNCAPGKSPLRGFRMIEVNRTLVSARAAHGDLATSCAPAAPNGALLFSYEDTLPDDTRRGQPVSGRFDDTAIAADVIVYRGFLNWAASLLRKLQDNPGYSASRRASILLRAIDSYAAMLALAEDETPRFVGICYDDWLTSQPYRAERLQRLGLEPRDDSLGAVQRYGGGSSFQKDATDAADLATTRRAEQMADDPEFTAILDIACRDTALADVLSRSFPADAEALAERRAS